MGRQRPDHGGQGDGRRVMRSHQQEIKVVGDLLIGPMVVFVVGGAAHLGKETAVWMMRRRGRWSSKSRSISQP
jgi:hypothetical protein